MNIALKSCQFKQFIKLLSCESRITPDNVTGVFRIEVGAFYWTDVAPDIVNSGREEQGLLSV